MSGLMRRLTRSRAATDDEVSPPPAAASEQVGDATDAPQGGVGLPANGVTEPRTAVLPATDATDATTAAGAAAEPAEPAPGRDLPAGVDPGELAAVPSSARRGRLRRRLRYLRSVRELLLRDLGGFYYEAQRSEHGVDPHRRLLEAKASRLATLDAEVRDLETHLDLAHPATVLREPGIGGTCPRCGELHGSAARFCSRCGTALAGHGRSSRPATTPTATPATKPPTGIPASGADDPKATTASLWGRPKRPAPVPVPATAEPETAVEPPAAPAEEPARTGSEPA
jgi:hypothetical protein